jgi:hypothetical protein
MVGELHVEVERSEGMDGPPAVRLRASLRAHARHFRKNHATIASHLAQARLGDRTARMVLARHALPGALTDDLLLTRECQAKGLIVPVHPVAVMSMLLGAISGPRSFNEVIVQELAAADVKELYGANLPSTKVSDQELESVVEIILRGLLTRKGRTQLERWDRGRA